MNRVWVLLPLVAACTAAPAFAQVTGRAEVRVGYDEVRAEVTVFDEAFTERFGESDFIVGAEVGVDARVTDNILVGAYAGIDFSQVDGCDSDLIFEGDSACIDAGRGFTAGLRAGTPVGDSGLIYVKGGYSRAKLKGSYHDGDDELFSDSDTTSGYHIGAGVELNVTSNVYVKGEYVHHRYKNIFEDSIPEPDGVDPTRHQLLFGVGVRFGSLLPPAPEPVIAAPPPPPPPAVATQTCPDGSVILATDMCPPPPPPPPPPPASGERG
jgi:outer membrane immunogenic protein